MGRRQICFVSGLLFTVLCSPAAHGAIISFATLNGANGNPFTGAVEAGFTVTPTSGSWFQSQIYGNSQPSIFDGPVFSPGKAAIAVTSGGSFTFNSLDYSSNNGGSTYLIQGFQGITDVFDETGTLAGTFGPFSFGTLTGSHSSVPINRLVIQISPGGNATSVNLDNINVSAIPEPQTLFLVWGGIGGLIALKKIRRRRG